MRLGEEPKSKIQEQYAKFVDEVLKHVKRNAEGNPMFGNRKQGTVERLFAHAVADRNADLTKDTTREELAKAAAKIPASSVMEAVQKVVAKVLRKVRLGEQPKSKIQEQYAQFVDEVLKHVRRNAEGNPMFGKAKQKAVKRLFVHAVADRHADLTKDTTREELAKAAAKINTTSDMEAVQKVVAKVLSDEAKDLAACSQIRKDCRKVRLGEQPKSKIQKQYAQFVDEVRKHVQRNAEGNLMFGNRKQGTVERLFAHAVADRNADLTKDTTREELAKAAAKIPASSVMEAVQKVVAKVLSDEAKEE